MSASASAEGHAKARSREGGGDSDSAATAASTAPAISSGVKSKARDILAAIRTLKIIEHEQRSATVGERRVLARFAGFGPVALSIFPNPVTGEFKDDGWRTLGEELKGQLTPEEYDSAKRTTFNAFYTSPTVIAGIHAAIERLGIPNGATILEPGCGIGNFMNHRSGVLNPNGPNDGQHGHHFIGIEMDRHLETDRAHTRHADDLLRHRHRPDLVGLLALQRDHSKTRRPRHTSRLHHLLSPCGDSTVGSKLLRERLIFTPSVDTLNLIIRGETCFQDE